MTISCSVLFKSSLNPTSSIFAFILNAFFLYLYIYVPHGCPTSPVMQRDNGYITGQLVMQPGTRLSNDEKLCLGLLQFSEIPLSCQHKRGE